MFHTAGLVRVPLHVTHSSKDSLELDLHEGFGHMWLCLTMSCSPRDGAEAAPGWLETKAEPESQDRTGQDRKGKEFSKAVYKRILAEVF